MLDAVSVKVEKILKIRDKLIAHQDKAAFENPEAFLEEIGDLTLQDLEPLIETAESIIYENRPTADLSYLAIKTPFLLMKVMSENDSSFIDSLRKYGFLRGW